MSAPQTAIHTETNTNLIEQIRALDEKRGASLAKLIYGKQLSELTDAMAREVLKVVRADIAERAPTVEPGRCFECGASVPLGKSHCIPCKEGMSRAEFSAIYRRNSEGWF
jgi:lipopolysaccharide biosynthesis regulator YciM